jgi:hypothetical protein
MEMQEQVMASTPRREPWNKGKLIGQKPPLRPKHVGSIRTRLQMDGRTRDLAMFNLAIDSKLRGRFRVENTTRLSAYRGTSLRRERLGTCHGRRASRCSSTGALW